MKTLFSIALIHYPVYNKHREVVTTAVTNLDIHDIARLANTFGADRYYIVTPVDEQQKLVARITDHWQIGWGATYNPRRKQALDIVSTFSDLKSVMEDMTARSGLRPKIVVTGAATNGRTVSSAELVGIMEEDSAPYLLLFGTGWGMTEELFDSADFTLAPIVGAGSYNHLSVRSAVSIYMDRLFGQRD